MEKIKKTNQEEIQKNTNGGSVEYNSNKSKKFLNFVWEITKVIVLAALIVVPIRYFLFQPFVVRGNSMKPNFHSGDYLIVDEISYRFNEPKRGDVIVFDSPYNPSQHFIKRIIGLPNEKIKIKENKVLVYNSYGERKVLEESQYLPVDFQYDSNISLELGPDEYFMMGDNRQFSSDSRNWGPIEKEHIIGRAFIKIFPFSAFAKIEGPSY